MSIQKNTTRFLRKRKMLLVLPLMVLPFITLIFWSLGGGKANDVMGQQSVLTGLNVELPSPDKNEQSGLSKLAFYEKVDKDSIQFKELIKNDPYYQNEASRNSEQGATSGMLTSLSGDQGMKPSGDPLENKVYSKLNELNKQLETSSVESGKMKPQIDLERSPTSIATDDVDRLEGMMRMMKEDKQYTDPELQQLDKMLEKIISIQHPEQLNVKSQVPRDTPNQIVPPLKKNSSSVFFGTVSDETGRLMEALIPIEVYSTQVLSNGSTIKLVLLEDTYLEDIFLLKGTMIYGTCSFESERLNIQVSSIKKLQSILPVKMQAYDLDGLRGLYIPQNVTSEVAVQSANDISQSLGMSSLDPSLAAKATDAGINMAKNLLKRKTKPAKVTVKAGHQLLLVSAN